MAQVSNPKIQRAITIVMFIALFALSPTKAQSQDGRPVADAGSSRYAATDPVQLDGTGSYDPDNSDTLSYAWQQIDGPPVIIMDANTATPTISGFVQTSEIQECEFELVVSDGEYDSLPDTAKVIIVPNFGENPLQMYSGAFDSDKPTMIYFGGGDCIIGYTNPNYGNRLPFKSLEWTSKANIIWLPSAYGPDPDGDSRTYYRYGDMILVYLSAIAPDYKQPIQTSGWSTGGQPAIDAAIRLNLTYKDPRYAVNHVTLLDAAPYCRDYTTDIRTYLSSSVEGEQCWVDNHIATIFENHADSPNPSSPLFHDNVLNIVFEKYEDSSISWLQQHYLGNDWYGGSLSNPTALQFNSGIVGGAYWSVIGPGKNLQLASATDKVVYKFIWYGDGSFGHIDFYDESNHPGRLPEPVTLIGPENDSFVDANGALFSCEESENAIGYQLLFGPDPYCVMDYHIVSDTVSPPSEVIIASPFEQTWWTVMVYDQYGSTIYADPIRVNFENLAPPLIENITTGQRYGSFRHAIDDAATGDEIVVKEGIYRENIDFKGKNLTVRSTDPNDSAVVAATVINGRNLSPVVTFSNGEDPNCVLAGFTITGVERGIFCSSTSPTITNCIIAGNGNVIVGAGIFCQEGSSPMITNCTFSSNSAEYFGGGLYSSGSNPKLTNCIFWENTPDEISAFNSTPAITYSNVRGGFPGEGNIDADPLFANPANGDYHLKSQAGRWDLISQSWIQDDVTSPCIDAGDPTSPIGLEPSPNGGRINMGAYGGTSEASKSP